MTEERFRATIYMSREQEEMLNELFIQRMREGNKTTKSCLLGEGLKLLFEKELTKDRK
jgi:hypothetical protein